MRPRLIIGLLFFAICLGLGYAGLQRYDPTTTEGLRDARRYVEMVNGTSSWTVQQELRVLVPFLARPISDLARDRVGKWQPELLFNREILYSFVWLLPLGLLRVRELPKMWIVSSAASLVTIILLSVAWGVGGNVSRPAFNAIAPLLTLSTALLLVDLVNRKAEATSAT